MTDIKSVLLDIVKHTKGADNIESVKIAGTKDKTILDAMDKERTVMLHVEFHEPVEEFTGNFGMGNLGFLASLTKFSNYQNDEATIEVSRREDDGEEIPHTLTFRDTAGGRDQYRFMSKMVFENIQVAHLRVNEWDVEFSPAIKNIAQLSEVSGIYSGIDPAFSVRVEDGNVVFDVGSAEGGVVGRRVFAENVEGNMSTVWSWPLTTFLNILKLGGETTVRFSDRGACQIEIDSGIAVYKFTLPAISR